MIALGLALLLSAPLQASTLEDANRQYEAGSFSGAIAAYQAVIAKEPSNAAAHFNLGNAYYKEGGPGSLGRAIASYERAFLLLPRDGNVRYNLDLALRKAGETLVPEGTPRSLHLIFHWLSAGELAGLHWLAFWALCLLGSAYAWRRSWRERLFPYAAAAAGAWLFFAAWLGMRSLIDVKDLGVITAANTEGRSGPGLQFPVGFNAPEGRRVTILTQRGEWLEVGVLKEGLRGWVPVKSIERI